MRHNTNVKHSIFLLRQHFQRCRMTGTVMGYIGIVAVVGGFFASSLLGVSPFGAFAANPNPPCTGGDQTYRVVSGDTLSGSVFDKVKRPPFNYTGTKQNLIAHNVQHRIQNADLIYPGDTICVPSTIGFALVTQAVAIPMIGVMPTPTLTAVVRASVPAVTATNLATAQVMPLSTYDNAQWGQFLNPPAWAQPWGVDESWGKGSCSGYAMLAVIKAYKPNYPSPNHPGSINVLDVLRQEQNMGVWDGVFQPNDTLPHNYINDGHDGSLKDAVKAVLDHYGVHNHLLASLTIDGLRTETNAGHPVIVGDSGNHHRVVVGVDNTYVYLADSNANPYDVHTSPSGAKYNAREDFNTFGGTWNNDHGLDVVATP